MSNEEDAKKRALRESLLNVGRSTYRMADSARTRELAEIIADQYSDLRGRLYRTIREIDEELGEPKSPYFDPPVSSTAK